MTKVAFKDLDFGSLERGRPATEKPRLELVSNEVSTDWNWMLAQMERFHPDVGEAMRKWDRRRLRHMEADEWRKIRGHMEAFEHRHCYKLTLDDLHDVVRKTGPTLLGVNKHTRDSGEVKDQTSPSPFLLTMDRILETRKRFPTIEEVKEYHVAKKSVYLDFIARENDIDVTVFDDDWLRHPIASQVSYRIGTAYNSFIREHHGRIYLGEVHGIQAKKHFMMDAEFKIDLLVDDIAIEAYLDNEQMKDSASQSGRKQMCREVNPHINVIEVPFQTRYRPGNTYNKPWLLTDAQLDEVALRIRERRFDYNARPKNL